MGCRSEELRAKRGCAGQVDHAVWQTRDGEVYRTCPTLLPPRLKFWVEAFLLFKSTNHLPFAGGLYDQPEEFLEVLFAWPAPPAARPGRK